MSGSVLTYNDTDFRTQIPFFANTTTYPQALMNQFFINGSGYISTYNYGFLNGARRQQGLYLMTAHLAALNDMIIANNGAAPGVVINAEIDKVKVGLQPPPNKNQWQWWLNQTPWGQQLQALLAVASAGGWYVGGMPERLGFRRVGGGFGGFRC